MSPCKKLSFVLRCYPNAIMIEPNLLHRLNLARQKVALQVSSLMRGKKIPTSSFLYLDSHTRRFWNVGLWPSCPPESDDLRRSSETPKRPEMTLGTTNRPTAGDSSQRRNAAQGLSPLVAGETPRKQQRPLFTYVRFFARQKFHGTSDLVLSPNVWIRMYS